MVEILVGIVKSGVFFFFFFREEQKKQFFMSDVFHRCDLLVLTSDVHMSV